MGTFERADGKRVRLQTQLIRVAAAMECLSQSDELSITDIYLAIRDIVPKACSRRTIHRDLEALAVIGLVESRWVAFRGPRHLDGLWLFKLATPVKLRERLEFVKRLTGKQKQILLEGRELA
jgi:hypothetical protein